MTYWVVEFKGNWAERTKTEYAQYKGSQYSSSAFVRYRVSDIHEATKFACKEDAERMIITIHSGIATEHEDVENGHS